MKKYICVLKRDKSSFDKYLEEVDDGDNYHVVSADNHFAFTLGKTYSEEQIVINDNNSVSLKKRTYSRLEFNKILIKIIRENIEPTLNLKGIKERYSFKNDLGMDSFDMLNLSVDIEKEFFVLIEDTELNNIKTVKDLKEILISKLKIEENGK